MSFVYFIVWQIKNNSPDDFKKALVGFSKDKEKDLLAATSPFTFWIINESSIFRFLKLIGCGNDKIGRFKKSVDERNHAAHSNGNIFFNAQDTIDEKITETVALVQEIQGLSKPTVLNHLKRFLAESVDPDEWLYDDPVALLREVLIHENYFSQRDIEICLEYDITELSKKITTLV